MPVTVEYIKGSELPEKVVRQFYISPERLYTITIDVKEEPSSAGLQKWKQALEKTKGLWKGRPDIIEEMEEIRKECDLLREEILGKDLPEPWRKKAQVAPDERVEIIIQPTRDEQVKELFELVSRVSDEAERKGLTDEKLAELLREEGIKR